MATDPPYNLSWNRRGIERLRALAERAKQAGILSEWIATFRRIINQLERYPLAAGDPLYPLPSLHLLMHQAIIERVQIIYGVHDTKPIVFIKDILPRFGHPLEQT